METHPKETAPTHDLRIEQAEARIEQAETRTEQAEMRTEQAKTRTEQAEARTEQAETRTEQAKTRTDEAEMRTDEVEKRSARALRNSTFSYRRLFDTAREGIIILEADSGGVRDVNLFLIELLGFSRDELVGKPIWELGPFRNLVANKATFEHLREQGYSRSEHLSVETRAAQKLAVEFVSNGYQDGDCQVIQCNVRDISERKRAEEQIRLLNAELEQRVIDRTVQLQAVNEALEAFSYSVSHDLRAPLRHISGFVTLLQDEAGPSLSEQGLHQLDAIATSAKHMGALIDDLLSFSRIGHSDMRKAPVDLGALVRDALEDFQAVIQKRSPVLDIHPLPSVFVDRALFRMVLVNLISNALKFSSKRAEARIEIGCAPASAGETVIFIRDNGAGFDPRYAGKLFGVFQRLHGHDEFEGTGIGLANVQRIIQRHGGRVWAEGVVDGGATFYVSIPTGIGGSA